MCTSAFKPRQGQKADVQSLMHCKYFGCKNCNYKLCYVSRCTPDALFVTFSCKLTFDEIFAEFATVQILDYETIVCNTCNYQRYSSIGNNKNFKGGFKSQPFTSHTHTLPNEQCWMKCNKQ